MAADDLPLEPVALKDVLENALGPVWCGIRAKKFIIFGLHVFIIVGLCLTDTYLPMAFHGLRHGRAYGTVYSLWLISVLSCHTAIYLSVFGSDPGWISVNSQSEASGERCRYCGAEAGLRSRHDFYTGQCIHKFDHFCWIMGTSIGDKNHIRFWLFTLVQTYLVLWGLVLVWHRMWNCGQPSLQVSCWKQEPWIMAGLVYMGIMLWLALNAVAGLFIFHTYLAASNQTTYEVAKGEKVAYLEPFYADYSGPKSNKLAGLDLFRLLWRVFRGQGPPRPFSSTAGGWRGVSENLDNYFFGKRMMPSKYTIELPNAL